MIADKGEFPGYWINAKCEVLSRRRSKPRVLKGCVTRYGYRVFCLVDADGKQVDLRAHRLIAFAFHGWPPEDKPFACHRDGDPLNNHPDNLYWGSPQENMDDRDRHGTTAKGRGNGSAKLTDADVLEIKRLGTTGLTHRAIAERFGVDRTVIGNILLGKIWSHVTGIPLAGRKYLTAEQVREIKRLGATGLAQRAIGKQFGVGQTAVSRILRGERWSHVQPEA